MIAKIKNGLVTELVEFNRISFDSGKPGAVLSLISGDALVIYGIDITWYERYITIVFNECQETGVCCFDFTNYRAFAPDDILPFMD